MNAKTWVPLTLAVVCALGAALVARQVMLSRPAVDAGQEARLRTVVVATGNILPGTEINPNLLTTAKVSPEMAQEDTFSDPGELAGRVAQAPIYKGQPLLGKLLAPKGSPSGLAGLVPPGMRAITIEVNEFSGVGGFLTPGCRVDLLSTVQGDRNGEMVSQTIVQNVMVTAIGQRMTVQREGGREEPPFRSVTLIATPEEAQAIELAAATGRPRLVLRNQRDHSRDVGAGVTLSDIRANNSGARTRGGIPGQGLSGLLGGLFAQPVKSDPTTGGVSPSDPFSNAIESPTTRPSDEAVAAREEPTGPNTWTIKVIRAGMPSEVSLPIPALKSPKSAPTPQPSPPKRPGGGLVGEPITETSTDAVGGK